MKAPTTKFQAPRKRDSNIEALVLLVIGVTIVLAIAITIVVVMVEFCGGLWVRPLSQDLFSAQVNFTYVQYISPTFQKEKSIITFC